MRWIFALLLLLFLILQYQLWFGDRGLVAVHRLGQKSAVEQQKVDNVKHQNELLMDKIKRVKSHPELVENYARQDLGMVKKGEVFYRFDHHANH